MDILIDSTDQWVRVRAMTAASAALTGKLAADFAFWYARQGAAPVAITPLVDKSPGDAHADGGVYEEGRGWYWVGVPDAAFVTGVPSVGISGTVSGGIVLDAPIRLKYSLQIADTGATAVSRLTAAQAADAVWDEAKSEHTTAGTFGLWLGTKLWNWLGALMGKTADATTRAEINATTAGAGYNETTDSQEAIRDRGDAAWVTGSGGDATQAKQDIIIAALAVVDATADAVLEDTGTTLPAQIAALDIGGGTGVYACTWTVNDGTTVLQGATVSFWLAGVLRGTGTTDASGEVSMSLDAGTYTVAISLSGYTFASTTHAVSSTASTWTKTFSMTAIVFSPAPDADQVTAWGYVYGPAATVEPGATIVLEQRTAGARQIYDNAPRTLTADGSGLVSAVVWADGSEYRYRRGTGGEWSELFAPEDDEDPDLPNSYRLPGWLGAS